MFRLACVLLLGFVAGISGRNVVRIVGGVNANHDQGRYQVSLRTLMNQHFCGGAILTQRWLVTAGHCTLGRKSGEFQAAVGALTAHEGVTHVVTNYIRHPSFDAMTLSDDIALLEIQTAIVFNERVQPVVISGRSVPANVETVLTGWGQLHYPGSVSSNLQALTMVTMTNEECLNNHRVDVHSPPIQGSNICAIRENSGACMGDSGSPLMIGNELVGIVSWGVPCARNFGDVFTRISMYQSWINQNIQLK
ncbi:hypothetical protein DMENIID0001_047370 [Sergentomyia squamirostris]